MAAEFESITPGPGKDNPLYKVTNWHSSFSAPGNLGFCDFPPETA